MKVIQTCLICGAEFSVGPARLKRGWGKYCSRACQGRANSELQKGNQRAKGSGGNRTSFAKGNKPWNKGLEGIHLSPNSEFKPGSRSLKRVPIGTVRIRTGKNGVKRRFIKTEDSPAPWVEFARIVWCNHHGPIPDGMVIHHKDRDTLNDAIDNLQVMTRSEHLAEHRLEIANKEPESAP